MRKLKQIMMMEDDPGMNLETQRRVVFYLRDFLSQREYFIGRIREAEESLSPGRNVGGDAPLARELFTLKEDLDSVERNINCFSGYLASLKKSHDLSIRNREISGKRIVYLRSGKVSMMDGTREAS